MPSSEEIIASCNNIVLYQFPEANSTDIFVYIFTYYIIILSCLYAVRQGNVLLKENGKEENALQLSNLSISIPTHNLFESLYLFCPNCDIFPCICKLTDKRSRNCILPLNKTHNEIKPDEDKTMNINNNPIFHPQQEAPNVKSLSSSKVINTNCNGSRKELALYRADSLHISKSFNPFDIPNTICLNCDNYQCTCLVERC